MSKLVLFNSCIARPKDEKKSYPLHEHLVQVKKFMENWVGKHPVLKENKSLVLLMGLAGACHDIAKADADWQDYILVTTKQKKGPSHAPAGAFLFSYLSYHILKKNGEWNSQKQYWIWIIRDLADHHGSLKLVAEDSWRADKGQWEKIDLVGVSNFFKTNFTDLIDVDISLASLKRWIKSVKSHLNDASMELLKRNSNGAAKISSAMNDLQLWRYLTTGLIAGDRFDIIETETSWLNEDKLFKSNRRIDQYCQSNTDHALSAIRAKAQQEILAQLEKNPHQRMYTLEMPTGYGKTITALKIAMWLGLYQQYRKIIYVAPYLSILEQTSEVIKDAMNICALEHHSLAIWDEKEFNSKLKEEKLEQKTPKSQLTTEAWAHDIICTSFQQFSKAIFPKRAQDVLRRVFLQDSIILIDEPQIFRPEGWNTFLSGLECMAEQYNLRIVFLSATMPTFEYGLMKQPTSLSVQAEEQIERYRICIEEQMDELQLAKFIVNRKEVLQGVILNTIEDAYLVHNAIIKKEPAAEAVIVHGLMIPIHKKMIIRKIQHHLKNKKSTPLIVISTQVLEAGVDVSFQHLARALPILPSIIQAAGRVNRHFENQDSLGRLSLFKYLRNGEKDTRFPIYSPNLQEITERLLESKNIWMESEMNCLIKQYYEEMFGINPYTASQQAIHAAHRGNWPKLSEFEPFGADLFRLPLFVLWKYDEADVEFISDTFHQLSEKFGLKSPEAIYDCYTDLGYWSQRDFTKRKQFMILLQHYVLNVPVRLAVKVVGKEDYLDNKYIPLLKDTEAYDSAVGMTTHFNEMSNIY